MTDDEIEKCILRADANWKAVTQGAPIASSHYGLFCFGDGPAAAAGGVGSFLWFPDRNAMLTFIAETLPFSPGGPAGSDCVAVAQETLRLTSCLRAGQMSDKEGLLALNSALRTFSQIAWMGTPTELKTSDSHYPRKVRSAFFEQRGDLSAPTAIDAQHEPEFYEFLETWGL